MKPRNVILLFVTILSPIFAPAAIQLDKGAAANPAPGTIGSAKRKLPGKHMTPEQERALKSYDSSISIVLDEQLVPSSMMGNLSDRIHGGDSEAEAKAAIILHGAAFRVGAHDAFTVGRVYKDKANVEHVRMTQTYDGIPVLDGVIVVNLSESAVVGISGRFVADLDLSTNPKISQEQAAAAALSQLKAEDGNRRTAEALAPVVLIDEEDVGRLAIPVRVKQKEETGVRGEDIFIDASSGRVVDRRESPDPKPNRVAAPAHCFNILEDPGFESGVRCGSRSPGPCTGWFATPGVLASSFPFDGLRNAWLCGFGFSHKDTLSQAVDIPSGDDVVSVSLSFYLDIKTEEVAAAVFDTLTIKLYWEIADFGPFLLKTFDPPFSNLDKTSDYEPHTFDLTPYKGRRIRVSFTGQEDASLQTSFRIDEVYVFACHRD